jgi:hypothetical protein
VALFLSPFGNALLLPGMWLNSIRELPSIRNSQWLMPCRWLRVINESFAPGGVHPLQQA